MDSNSQTRFGLMRHAPTEWNARKKIQGQQDSPLTSLGRRQVIRWGDQLRHFPWQRILTSDLGRTQETSRLLAGVLSLPVTETPLLREQDWGRWTGMTFLAVREAFPAQVEKMDAQGWTFCPPGGENRISVFKRGIEALTAAGDRWPGEQILVVTHAGMIKSLVYRMAEALPGGPEAFLIQPGHLHWFRREGAGVVLEQVNAIRLENE